MKAAKTRALHKKAHKPARRKGSSHAAPAHHPAAKAAKVQKKPKAPVKRTAAQVKAAHVRAWSPGALPCCSAEAVAASLRLAGGAVSDSDVLALYRLAADSPGAGASVLAVLEAAFRFGLAGVRPLGFEPVALGIHELHVPDPRTVQHHPEFGALQGGEVQRLDDVAVALLDRDAPVIADLLDGHGGDVRRGDASRVLVHPASVILGLDMPEAPHAVTLDPSGAVWSWGALYELTAEAVIEEAWAVSWPVNLSNTRHAGSLLPVTPGAVAP